jgi:hypothetical protein
LWYTTNGFKRGRMRKHLAPFSFRHLKSLEKAGCLLFATQYTGGKFR